jgi:hypothetical protein
VIHVFVSDPLRLLGVESVTRQGAAQPQPSIRLPGRGRRCGAERQHAAELAAQVGIQAVIVDPLQPVQRRLVHAGAQKASQVFIAGPLTWLASKLPSMITASAPVGCRPSGWRSATFSLRLHQIPHRRGDQAVLVLKVVTDDAVRDTGQTGDQRNAGVPHPDLIDRLQSGFDQLLAADGLHTDLGHFCISLGPAAATTITGEGQSILF